MFSELAVEYRIHRPQSGNSFGLSEARELAEALTEAEKRCKPLVLTAVGRFFCAGGDVKAYARFDRREPGLQINREIRDILEKIHRARVPTVVLVQGDCFGGGVELISCFDKVIAARHACFGLWQRKIGLSFGWGGAARLQKRLSQKNLVALALEAGSFSADRALSIGLVDEAVPMHLLKKRGADWLKQVSAWSDFPLKALKGDLPRDEVSVFEEIWMNEDHQASLARLRGPAEK